jgi:hypothetical protein
MMILLRVETPLDDIRLVPATPPMESSPTNEKKTLGELKA